MTTTSTTTTTTYSVSYEPRGTWGVRTASFATREEAVAFVDANGEGHVHVGGYSEYIRYDNNTVGYDKRELDRLSDLRVAAVADRLSHQ